MTAFIPLLLLVLCRKIPEVFVVPQPAESCCCARLQTVPLAQLFASRTLLSWQQAQHDPAVLLLLHSNNTSNKGSV